MIIKTCELEGAALDWAVACTEGFEIIVHAPNEYRNDKRGGVHCCEYGCTVGVRKVFDDDEPYSPSTDWSRGGPLIAEYLIELMTNTGSAHGPHERWYAVCPTGTGSRGAMGPTALVAAMRALVMAMLGDEVDVPDEIAKSGG